MADYNPLTVVTNFLSAPLRRRFRAQLLRWFDREKRELPWRGESDPYRILVSEVMLQQTRVAVVKERYQKFLRQFPTVSRLARAREETVLAAWSGLGYYRRARALHAAAKSIRENGGLPGSAAELMHLPGIGRYTAAAVASIAFGKSIAVVDGNVKRVLQRLSGSELSGDGYWQTAQELLEQQRPGDFNQAMMELGATVCVPSQPLCAQCPVTTFCASRGASGRQARAPALRKTATLRYLLAQKDGAVFLQQRPADVRLMPGMWELPLQTGDRLLKRKSTKNGRDILKLRHSITTTDYTILVRRSSRRFKNGSRIPLQAVTRLPLTGLTRKILRRLELIA